MTPEVPLGRYIGPVDYVLCEGEFFDPPGPDVVATLDLLTLCFTNAFTLARKSRGGLQYAEGYAFSDWSRRRHLHAWCADAHGRVVDPTWHGGDSPRGLAYLGKTFDLRYVARVRRGRNGSASVIDNWRNNYPLLRA